MNALLRSCFRARIVIIIIALTFAGCDDSKPKTAEKPKSKPKPIETPCKGGEFIVRHAYPQCQSDGLWHIVEDIYYKCPPEGKITAFRAADTRTKDSCNAAPPSPIGIVYFPFPVIVNDSICNPAGEVVIPGCVNGKWVNFSYSRTVCYRYEGTRVVDSISYYSGSSFGSFSKNDSTNVPCDSMPPIPKMK